MEGGWVEVELRMKGQMARRVGPHPTGFTWHHGTTGGKNPDAWRAVTVTASIQAKTLDAGKGPVWCNFI